MGTEVVDNSSATYRRYFDVIHVRISNHRLERLRSVDSFVELRAVNVDF